tara:strand:- start:527 stop:1414 length:888 start_codon:yes stop_codon:yes gene_type:complete
MSNIINKIYKASIWTKVMAISIILLCIFIANRPVYNIEGFEQREKLIIKNDENIYDSFYCSIYDEIKNNPSKNELEASVVINNTLFNKSSKLLDIGSGTGEHVSIFNKKNINASGIDKSKFMVHFSKEKYNDLKFINGDVNISSTYKPHLFSHITMFNLTVYELDDKYKVFSNCYEWLKPGGYLIIHFVNKDKYLPPINNYNPLKLLDNNRNKKIKFNNFDYTNNFEVENNNAKIKEIFRDKNNKVRQNIQELNIDSIKNITNIIKRCGYIQDVIVDLNKMNYQNEFLYFFYKPE